MTDPVDPNASPPWQPQEPYSPPPPSGPPPGAQTPLAYGEQSPYGQQPAYVPPPPSGQQPTYAPPPPYGQQPAYPPPAYPAQYPSPGYASGQWPAQPYPSEPHQVPKKSRTTLFIVLGVLVLAAGGIVAAAVLASGGSSTRHITPPESIGTYSRLHSSAAQSVEDRLRNAGSASGSAFFRIASLASYGSGTGDLPNLVAAVMSTKDLPESSNLSAQDIVDEMFQGVAAPGQADNEDPGTHGGAVECSQATFGAAHESVCAWSDNATTGLVFSVNPALPSNGLAQLVQQLRDQIE